MEQDKLTQLHINTKNIMALVEQLKLIQVEQQNNVEKIYKQAEQIVMLNTELAYLKQQFFILKATVCGHGATEK